MVLNINHSLVMEGANKRFKNESLHRIPIASESYHLMGLNAITEMKEEMNNTLIEFYKLSELNTVSEANVQDVAKTVWNKIVTIFNAIIKGIIRIKNFIMSAIDVYIANRKRKKKQEAKRAEKEDREKISEYYTKDMYFNVTMYNNTLTNEISDTDWPSPDLIYNSNQISSLISVVDEMVKKKSWDIDGATQRMGSQLDVVINMRLSLREKLVPKNYMKDEYLNDDAYAKGLYNVLTNNDTKDNKIIDVATALRSYNNLKVYDDIIAEFTKAKNNVNSKYNAIISDIEKLKKEAEERVKNPRKYAIQNNVHGPVSSEVYIESIARLAATVYEILIGALNDHLLAYTTKLHILVEKETVDRFIIDHVMALVDQKAAREEAAAKNESSPILIDTNAEYFELCREADEALDEFCTGCLLLRQEQSDYNLHEYIHEHVLMEADEDGKTGFGDRIAKLVEYVVNMFKRFGTSIDALITRDKKWIEQHGAVFANANYKFPNQNEKIGEWIDYQVDEFTKSSNIPVFDMTNKELMNALESEETFSKYIFSKLGGSEASITSEEAKNGSFSKKCEAIFSSGGQQKEVLVSQLQTKKDEMLKYCKDYLNGDASSIYKNIVKESTVLDNSKKNVLRTLKTHKTTTQTTQQTNPEQKEATAQTTQTTSTTTSAGAQGNAKTAPAQNAQASGTSAQTKTNEDFNFDLAAVLGICENSFLMELQMPKTDKADRAAIDQNVSAAGGDDKDTLKDLREKANRFFTMYGNMLGAKMSCSMKCYKQYAQLFRWALKSVENRPAENTETVNTDANDKSIADMAKEK